MSSSSSLSSSPSPSSSSPSPDCVFFLNGSVSPCALSSLPPSVRLSLFDSEKYTIKRRPPEKTIDKDVPSPPPSILRILRRPKGFAFSSVLRRVKFLWEKRAKGREKEKSLCFHVISMGAAIPSAVSFISLSLPSFCFSSLCLSCEVLKVSTSSLWVSDDFFPLDFSMPSVERKRKISQFMALIKIHNFNNIGEGDNMNKQINIQTQIQTQKMSSGGPPHRNPKDDENPSKTKGNKKNPSNVGEIREK